MFGWRVLIAIAVSAAILLTLLIAVILRRCYCFSKQGTEVTEATATAPPPRRPPQQSWGKIEGWSSQGVSRAESRTRPNYSVFQRGSSTKPLFNWSDHPLLITDAVENGWSRFAFTNYASSASTRSTLFGCIEDLHHHQPNQRDTQVEITWEVGEGYADLMQKIRMNSGLKKLSSNSFSTVVKSVIRTALPLPGPSLGNYSFFPQEAYFEITILSVSSSSSRGNNHMVEGEKTKLIRDKDFDGSRNSDSIIHVASKSASHASEELKLGSRAGDRTALMMSVGLTSSSLVPLRIPGSYRGSIGFNSDGSVYLDGIKLVFESAKEGWGQQEKVIGCGFNPMQKKVFFTVDSELVLMVNCKSEEFGIPLYPVIAANADITVLVNLGQGRFSYEPANAMRTPNPCFVGSILSSPATTGYEDSGELFSIGRIDSGWLNHCTTKSSTNSDVYSWYSGTCNSNNNNGRCRSKPDKEDDESEADLFEIVLDVNGKSPKV